MGMLTAFRLLRTAIIAVGLISLAFVLVPAYVEPLWNWVTFVTSGIGPEVLPSFNETQHLSGMASAGFVLCGVAYSVWRDRRFGRLQAEYSYRTGANQLKGKVADLETELRNTVQERNKLEQAYEALTKQLTDALVSSKEHEVRSEYGKEDRQLLSELRKEDSARPMHLFLTNHRSEEMPEVCVERLTAESTKEDQPAIPYLPRYAKPSGDHRHRLAMIGAMGPPVDLIRSSRSGFPAGLGLPNNQSTYHLVSKTFFRLPGKGITGFRGRSRDFAFGIKDEYRQNLIRRRLNPARALSAEARLNGRHGPGPRSPCPGKAQLSFPWNGIHTTFLFLKEKKSK